MSQPKKYKIALIGFRLGIGGAEKVMADLSIFFEKKGIEIHNIILIDEASYDYSGKLIVLEKHNNFSNKLIYNYKRFLFLRKYFKENNFDYIIDFRFRMKPIQEFLISKLLYDSKTIFTVHSFMLDIYLTKSPWFARKIFNKCYKIVTISDKVSEIIKENYKLKNISRIYNPIDIQLINEKANENIDLDFDYIIAVGQMENNIKQFDKLIDAYAKSDLPKSNIHLVLLGDGERKLILKSLAKENNLDEKVHFLGFQKNPFKFIKKAKFLVLTSKNEGLPNVILESLASQTPVISFDCLSGPSEMIIDKVNGLLVENQNLEKLVLAMNLFLKDEILYKYCKENTLESIKSFSVENIGKQWLDLMKIDAFQK